MTTSTFQRLPPNLNFDPVNLVFSGVIPTVGWTSFQLIGTNIFGYQTSYQIWFDAVLVQVPDRSAAHKFAVAR